MIEVGQFVRRVRRRSMVAATLFFGGALMLVVDYTTRIPTAEKGEFAFVWLFAMGVGGFFYYLSMELPTKEILQIAEDHQGLVTVGELTTALGVGPELALRGLSRLQRMGLASPRWEELQKNLWEFPDYVKLPISEAVELARKQGGRVTLQDLIAVGQSVDVAQQTMDAMREKGLGRADSAGIALGQGEGLGPK